MKDIGVHIFLFLVVSFAIAALGSMFADPEDGAALKNLPRRFVMFIVGCGILTAIMLVCESTLAS